MMDPWVAEAMQMAKERGEAEAARRYPPGYDRDREARWLEIEEYIRLVGADRRRCCCCKETR